MANEDLDLDVDGLDEAPKSKKKLFIIIGAVVLVILLAVGGMFAMGVFSSEEPVAEEGATAEDGEELADTGKEGGGAKDQGTDEEAEVLSDDAIYWPIEPPFVMNFEGRSKAKYMQIKIVAMSRSQKSMAALKKHMPAIRNELTFLLGSQKFVEMSTPTGKEQLREEILETINTIIKGHGGGRGLQKVYFTSFVMQ